MCWLRNLLTEKMLRPYDAHMRYIQKTSVYIFKCEFLDDSMSSATDFDSASWMMTDRLGVGAGHLLRREAPDEQTTPVHDDNVAMSGKYFVTTQDGSQAAIGYFNAVEANFAAHPDLGAVYSGHAATTIIIAGQQTRNSDGTISLSNGEVLSIAIIDGQEGIELIQTAPE
jgi:hypothetical protein